MHKAGSARRFYYCGCRLPESKHNLVVWDLRGAHMSDRGYAWGLSLRRPLQILVGVIPNEDVAIQYADDNCSASSSQPN
jgi:hypothetical protein